MGVHFVLSLHYSAYHPSLSGVLWSMLPFVLNGLATYAVRHSWLSCLATVGIGSLLLASCLMYAGVTDHDQQPYFLLEFLPVLQLFGLIAFVSPVLASTWFAYEHRAVAHEPNAG